MFFYVIVMDYTPNGMVMPRNGIVEAYSAVSRCGQCGALDLALDYKSLRIVEASVVRVLKWGLKSGNGMNNTG